LGFGEVDANLAALFLNIRSNAGVRQINDHIAFAQLAPLEIDIADRFACWRINLGSCGSRRWHGNTSRALRSTGLRCLRRRSALTDHDKQIIAINP